MLVTGESQAFTEFTSSPEMASYAQVCLLPHVFNDVSSLSMPVLQGLWTLECLSTIVIFISPHGASWAPDDCK
jgi:hypothetical protein